MLQISKRIRIFFLTGLLLSRLLSAEDERSLDFEDKKISFATRSIESDTKKAIVDALNAITSVLQILITTPLIDTTGIANYTNCSVTVASLFQNSAPLVQDNANYINSLNAFTASLQTIAGSATISSAQIIPLLQSMNNVFVAIPALLSNSNFTQQNKPAVANALFSIAFLFEDIVAGSVISGQAQFDAAARTAIAFVAMLDAIATLWGDSNKLTFFNDYNPAQYISPAYDTYAHTCLTAFSTLTNGSYVYTANSATVNKLKTVALAIEKYVTRLMVLEGFSQHYFDLSGEPWPIPSNGFRFRSILVAPDGNYWVTDGTRIIQIDSTTFARTTYTPTANGSYINMVFDGTKQNIWFADSNNNVLCKFNLSTKTTTTYSIVIPGENYDPGRYPVTQLSSVACGKDGNVWFLAAFAENHYGTGIIKFRFYLGSIDGAGVKSFYQYANYPAGVMDTIKYFTVDCYGNFWIAGLDGMFGDAAKANKVAFYKVTPAGNVTRIYIPAGNILYTQPFKSFPYGASDGKIWIVLENQSFVCLAQDGTVSNLQSSNNPGSGQYLYNITEDLQKRIWIAGNYVVCVDPTSTIGTYPAIGMPTDKMVRALCIACDASGNIVFPGEDYTYPNSKICKIILSPTN